MNEITHIHLGRQSYTIAVDAHKSLREYLANIENVADKEVLHEVELRMSELLIERGVTGKKVILLADVNYLKEQLGNAADFSEADDETHAPKATDKVAKRLFRDTDNAMIAGVAAGIADYTGRDVGIIRLIFVLLTIFSAGTGLLLYVVLWLAIQPAETASEKLQMKGKPVTLEALKNSVNKADVAGAAKRANKTMLPVLNTIFRIGLKVIGIGFILAGIGLFFSVGVTKVYMLLHNDRLFQENLFPVGSREHLLLTIVLGLIAIVGIFLLLTGIATMKRKWPIRGWITGVLAGLFLVGSGVSVALAADAAPHIQDRYEASIHTTALKGIKPFNAIVSSGDVDIAYASAPEYSANVHYVGHPDLSKLKVYVKNNTLYIDSTALEANRCTMLCLFPRYNMTVQVYAPNVERMTTPPGTDVFYPRQPVLN